MYKYSIIMRKNCLPFFLVLLLPAMALAQITKTPRNQRWEIGLQGGVAQGQNDLNNFGQYDNKLGGGLVLRYHLDNFIALRANVLYAEIAGDDRNYDDRGSRGFRFSAPLTEGSIVAEMDLLGRRRWSGDKGGFKHTFSPYFFGGVGLTMSQPSVSFNMANNDALRERINTDIAKVEDGKYSTIKGRGIKNGHVVMPLGLGVKYDLSENWVLGLETGLRIIFDDYIDGVSASANPRKGDTYSLTALTATYRFPYAADSDRDGIPDSEDACPNAKGTADTKGCPDSDADGLADNLDACPDMKGARTTQGCPDTDGDGISDKGDVCPDEKGTLATGGCPDKDKDGIPDSKDDCPEVFGLAKFGGCADSDNDGIKDSDDQCPNEAGDAAHKGCPANDRDRDGIKDNDDKCPDVAGKAATNGCPDTDNDGVANNLDRCPDEPGTAANNGCPAISEADAKVLEAAIYGVQFEPAKSVIKTTSFGILDQVAAVMQRYPAYNLDIAGHTDSDGTDASNQRLSEARAKACFDYLVSKGVDAKRMKHSGFGESKPVADNNTKEGKSKNRRVEFKVNVL
jgi:OmpA-OmpF porin, OOP family